MLQLQTTHAIKSTERALEPHTHTWAQCDISEHKLIGLLETLITLLSHMSFMQSRAQSSSVGVTRLQTSPSIGPKWSLNWPNNEGTMKTNACLNRELAGKARLVANADVHQGGLLSRCHDGRRELWRMTWFGFSVWTSLVSPAVS